MAFMILGGLLLLAGAALRLYRYIKEPYKGRAVATVVEIQIDAPDTRGKERGVHDYFYAVFSYFAGSRLIKKRYPRGGNPCPFKMNERIPIYYKTEDPEVFKLADPGPLRNAEYALYACGALLLLIGFLNYMQYAVRYI